MKEVKIGEICRSGGKSLAKATRLTAEAAISTLTHKLSAESVRMNSLEELLPKTKELILENIFSDLDASVEQIKKDMPMMMAKFWKNENKAKKTLKQIKE